MDILSKAIIGTLFWGSLGVAAYAVYSGNVAAGVASVAMQLASVPRQIG